MSFFLTQKFKAAKDKNSTKYKNPIWGALVGICGKMLLYLVVRSELLPMKQFIVLLITILTFSCSSNSEHRKEEEVETINSTPSVLKVSEIEVESQNQAMPEPTNKYTIDDIQGVWSSFDSLENAYFLIDGDSIFYLEGEAFPLEVSFDSMRIKNDLETHTFKINWIRGDTMSYISYGFEELILRRSR